MTSRFRGGEIYVIPISTVFDENNAIRCAGCGEIIEAGKLSPKKKRIIHVMTRCIGVIIFLFIAYHFFAYGLDVRKTGERTASFKIPYYPFAFALSFSFLLQSFTIFCDLIKKVKGADK